MNLPLENHTDRGRIVVVDDERTLPWGSVHLRNSQDAMTYLQTAPPVAELWLDHDLGDDDTTRPIALWLAERAHHGDAPAIALVVVHTMNPVGRDWLVTTLKGYRLHVRPAGTVPGFFPDRATHQ